MRISFVLFFLLIIPALFGQGIAEAVLKKPVKKINKEANFITTDRLGNLYVVNSNYIWMYNRDGDSLRAFNTKRYGEISFVDCSDPYKILVFFKDFNVILYLDNFLSENGPPRDMQELGFDQATLVCLSQERGFWVFDQLKQKALRLDANFQVTHETVNFIQWFGRRLLPNYMEQYNNRLYLNEPESGVYVFDHFGTYIKKIPLIGLKNPQMLEKVISYVEDGKYCNFKLMELENQCDSLQVEEVYGARKEKGRFYMHSNRGVEIFKTN